MDSAQNSMSSLVVPDDALQTKVNFFLRELQDLGVGEEQIQALSQNLITLVSEHLIAKVDMLMNDEEFNNWKKLIDDGANTAQQAIVIDSMLKNKIGKSLDILQTEIADELMRNIIDHIKERRDLIIKISKLSDTQVADAIRFLESGDYDKLETLLN